MIYRSLDKYILLYCYYDTECNIGVVAKNKRNKTCKRFHPGLEVNKRRQKSLREKHKKDSHDCSRLISAMIAT